MRSVKTWPGGFGSGSLATLTVDSSHSANAGNIGLLSPADGISFSPPPARAKKSLREKFGGSKPAPTLSVLPPTVDPAVLPTGASSKASLRERMK